MDYGRILKQLREDNGLTQSDIASILGISRGLYSQYEIADKIIPIQHLNTLSNYFNVSIDYIFGFTNHVQYNDVKQEIDGVLSGQRLKEFRKEDKITQAKLATILNTVQPVIANYEKGRNLIATPFLYMICNKYHISADYLLGKVDYPKNLS